jgi:DTW domain-containing protein YfiP
LKRHHHLNISTAWTGFGDYVESFGSKPTGGGNGASFEEMLEAALAAEEAKMGCQQSASSSAPSSSSSPRNRTASSSSSSVLELPLQFELPDLMACTEDDSLFALKCREEAIPINERVQKKYRLTCGLLIKARQATIRLLARSQIMPGIDFSEKNEEAVRIYCKQIQNLCCDLDQDQKTLQGYIDAPGELFDTSVELVAKRIPLSKKLIKALEAQPLLPLVPQAGDFSERSNRNYDREGDEREERLQKQQQQQVTAASRLQFEASFLREVDIHFCALQKPLDADNVSEVTSLGTHAQAGEDDSSCSSDPLATYYPMMADLMALKREECSKCGLGRALYCPDCDGLRTPQAENMLPPRVSASVMPFEVMMILHYQETINRSTGAQALALLEEGYMSVRHWPRDKDSEEMSALVASIDPSRDVLLFPDAEAHSVGSLLCSPPGGGDDGSKQKRRLIMIEANWTFAKAMAGYLKGRVPGLRSVGLHKDVVGTYWRFQAVSASAVSTIEALYHAANEVVEARNNDDNGDNGGELRNILVLFEYQRRKMLANASTKQGAKCRGLRVTGNGIHDWAPILEAWRRQEEDKEE